MKNEPYTLITGASEGLGKAFAMECAGRSMNLALIALPGNELPALADFIKRNFQVEVIYLNIDLTEMNAAEKVVQWISEHQIEINVLINNAGMGSTGAFPDYSPEFYRKQIQLNVVAVTLLTRLLIPQMLLQNPAYILNVASLTGFFTVPYKDVYAATKAFIISFSKSLSFEMNDKNIFISVLCPGGMNTNLNCYTRTSHHGWLARQSIMEPEAVASIAIKKLFEKKRIIIPGTSSKIFMLLNAIMPGYLKNLIIHYSFKKEHQLNKLSMQPVFK